MDVGSKRLVAGGVIAASLMLGSAALVVGAGLAHADALWSGSMGDHNAYAMWEDIHPFATGEVVDAEGLAETICGAIVSGRETEHQVLSDIMAAGNSDHETAQIIIRAAEYHYCSSMY